MRKLGLIVRVVVTAFTVATAVYAYRSRQPTGRFYNVPYDFRFPTIERIRSRWWNSEDPRIFTPHVFGVGWSINLYQIRQRLQGSEMAQGELDIQQPD